MGSIERRLKRLGACLARPQGEAKGHPKPAANKRRAHRHALDGVRPESRCKVVDHAERYAEGRIHTNGLENFWSLLKLSLKGTYESVEPYQLFRYLDEQIFRFNEREGEDAERFEKALGSVSGRRLTYSELTGK